jgi:hypothetical protein
MMKVKVKDNWGCAELISECGGVINHKKCLVTIKGKKCKLKGFAFGRTSWGHGMGYGPSDVGFMAVYDE